MHSNRSLVLVLLSFTPTAFSWPALVDPCTFATNKWGGVKKRFFMRTRSLSLDSRLTLSEIARVHVEGSCDCLTYDVMSLQLFKHSEIRRRNFTCIHDV